MSENDQAQALTLAYVLGARAKTHEEMTACVRLAGILERGLPLVKVADCKLRAELELERR